LGYVFEDHAETVFRSPWVVVGTMSVMAVLLWIADRPSSQRKSLAELPWGRAVIIGICQGLAIVPGVSRSGITISMALLLGLNRTDAVRFSFFLSVPIILGAGLLKLPFLIDNAGDPSVWVGLATAALAGAAAIHFLLTYVRSNSFLPFVVYRLVLAGFLALWLARRF
jgi:undecaprenyl-diphosphatase